MINTPASKAHSDDATLADLLDEARADFGVTCFWNVPTDGPPRDFAELAVRKLRKYGGMAGWHLAQRIEAAIAADSLGPH